MRTEEDILRDQLAQDAMRALIEIEGWDDPKEVAEESWKFANAMIEERRKHVASELAEE